jgi:ketosteroid isomerase-like protein
MSETEAALAGVRNVTDALNSGEDTDVLAGMADDVVIIDDVAPFHWTGHQEAQQWLRRVARTRKRLSASLSLDSAAVQLAGDRAYLVAPGAIKGGLADADFEVDGLVTSTLIVRNGKWLVDSLVWSCGR